MTDTTDPMPTDTDAGELERLREHNKQLLAELKEARAALKPAQDSLERAQARLRVALVDEPLAAIAQACSPFPGAFLRALKDRIDVVLDDEYRPHVVGKDGEPIEWEDRPYANRPGETVKVDFTHESIRRWLRHHAPCSAPDDSIPEDFRELAELLPKPSGTGATGSAYRSTYSPPAEPKQEPASSAPTPTFGLR